MGYYVITRTSDSQFMFNLLADNHEKILTSERYTEKRNCLNGIASVQKNSPHDKNYDRLTSKRGSPYFTLKSGDNGQVIGVSEEYSSTSARETGIASCKVNGPTTDIRDKS